MGADNTDFETMFAESTLEVEAGGGETAETKKQNAKIHKGDGEVDDPQAELNSEADENEGDETDESEVDDDEVSDDETSDDDETDTPDEFDIASHIDELITVKVDGEEMSVPLGEVVKGYMRQSDYTRKTQQVAELRAAAEWGKQMRDALLEDPEGVIQGLAQSFGLQLGESTEADLYSSDDPELAPVLQELKSTKVELANQRKFIEQMQQRDIDNQTRAEVAQVEVIHPDFKDADVKREVLQIAIKSEGKLSIEESYDLWKGRQIKAKSVDEAAKAAKVAKVANAEAKKRKVQSQTTTGSKRNAGAGAPANTGDSFADMLQFDLADARKG